MPSVLDLFGLAPMAMDGLSLLPAIRRGEKLAERSLYAESMYPRRFGWSPLRALRDGRFKLVDAPRPELYDLDVDRFEEHDLSKTRPDLVNAMRAALPALDATTGQQSAATPPAEVRARLAALGYTNGTARFTAGDAADPKDHIQEYNAIRRDILR
jgi:arylsulfatase A-like enzyme